MPLDRFFHPRAGHSAKVCSLTDSEFRVWWTYQMAADDYGVMRLSATTIKAANDAFEDRKPAQIERALKRLIDVGLLVPFEHQRRTYVCQLDWQDFQKIRYPRESHEPTPSADVLARCSEDTAELFARHSRKASEIKLERISEILETKQTLQRAPAREEAKGLRLTANGSEGVQRKQNQSEPSALDMRGGRLLERYAELFYEHRKGAKYHSRPSLDFPKAQELVRTWDDDGRLEKLAVLVLTTDDDWIARTDRGFAVFAARASWADGILAEWEAEQAAKRATS